MELDAIDKKILSLLDFDARMGCTALGKKIGKTKQYVRHRVERLKQKGIITGVDTVIDVTKLGYFYVRARFRLSKATPEIEQEMLAFFKQRKHVAWLISLAGQFDLGASFMVRSIAEFERDYDAFSSKFHEYIADAVTTIATKIWHFPHKFFDDKPNTKEWLTASDDEVSIDEKDKDILRALWKDGSANSVTLGKEVGLSPAAVLSRMKRLQQDGVILGFRPKLNLKALGYEIHKVYLQTHLLNKEFLDGFVAYCRSHKNILYVTKALGHASLEFEIAVQNNGEFRRQQKEILSKFSDGIKDRSSVEMYQFHVVNYTPF